MFIGVDLIIVGFLDSLKQPCGFRKAVCYNIRMGSYAATAVAVVVLYFAYKGGGVDSLSCVVVGNSRLDSLLCKYGAVELCRRQTVKRFYDRFIGQLQCFG